MTIAAGGQLDSTATPGSHRRLLDLAFGGALAIVVAMQLFLNRNNWFFLDEFSILSERAGQLRARGEMWYFFSPHNEHWSTGPILIYRLLFKLDGLHSYVLYMVPVLLAHVGVVWVARRLMIRAGITPWVATGVALVLAFFGAGAENLTWAFQVGFVGSMFFGLVAIWCVDTDGPLGRRGALAFCFGLLSLMFSGIGITMAVVLGLHLAVRRRWKAMLLVCGSLTTVFLAWYAKYGHLGKGAPKPTGLQLLGTPRFIWKGLSVAIDGFTQITGSAVVVLTVLIAVAATTSDKKTRNWVIACGGGLIAFYVVAAYGRISFGVDYAGVATRYVYTAGVLLMFPIAAALDAIILSKMRRRAIIGGALAWMIGANGVLLIQADSDASNFHRSARNAILAVTELPGVENAPRDRKPSPAIDSPLSLGSLLDWAKQGKLPKAGLVTEHDLLTAAQSVLVDINVPMAMPPTTGQLVPAEVRNATATPADGCLRIQPTGAQPQIRLDLTAAQRYVAVAPLGGKGNLVLASRDLADRSPETPITFPEGSPVVIDVTYQDAWIVLTLPTDAPTVLCQAG